MIANARMYSVSLDAAELWRDLLTLVIERAGLPISLFEHPPPAPMSDLWTREDKAAVFMCGLPFSRALPVPVPIAVPVPSPVEFAALPYYWSEFVVRTDSQFESVADTFGRRIAFTSSDSQSGYAAALTYLMQHVIGTSARLPFFSEIIAPQITPLGALTAVLDGSAEIAPVDAYAYRLLERFCPELITGVRVVGSTAPTPMPLLVASGRGLEALQFAFLDAHAHAPTASIMRKLMLARFVAPNPHHYAVLRGDFERARGYWQEHPLASMTHPAFAPV